MPVDLSKIGLEGIESYHANQESKSRANYNNVLADTGRAKLESEERNRGMLAIATARAEAANANDQSGNEVSRLRHVGHEMIKIGGVELGADLLKTASEIEENEQQAKKAQVDQIKTQNEVVLKTAEFVDNQMSAVTDDRSFNMTVDALERAQAAGEIYLPDGTIEKLREYGYDPEVIQVYRDHAIKAKDRANLELQSLRLDISRDTQQRLQNNADRNFRLSVEREAHQQQWRADVIANGGKNKPNVLVPTEAEIASARSMLLNGVFYGVGYDSKKKDASKNATVDTAAAWVAAEARQLRRDNPALSGGLSMQQAITKAQNEGIIKRIPRSVTGDKPQARVDPTKALGRTPETALAPPRGADGKVDRTKMKAGTHYTHGGKTYLYDGKGLKPIQ